MYVFVSGCIYAMEQCVMAKMKIECVCIEEVDYLVSVNRPHV